MKPNAICTRTRACRNTGSWTRFEQKVTLLRLAANGKYREVRPKKGELHSQVVPGFWIRPEWLWQDPLPKKVDVLKLLLQRLS